MYISYAYDYVQTLYFACEKCFDCIEPAFCYFPDTEILDRYFLLMKAQMGLLYFKETTLKKLSPEKCEKVMDQLLSDYRTPLSSALKTYYAYFHSDPDWWNAKMLESDRIGIRYKMDNTYVDLRERVLSLWNIPEMPLLVLHELFEHAFQSLRNQEIPVYKWNHALYQDFCLRMEWEKQQIRAFDPFHFPAHFNPQPDEEYKEEKQRYAPPTPPVQPQPLSPSSTRLADYWQGSPEILNDLLRQCIFKEYLPQETDAHKFMSLEWKGPKTVLYDILNQCMQKGHIRTCSHICLMKYCIRQLGLAGSPADLASKYSATLQKRPPKESRIEVKPIE